MNHHNALRLIPTQTRRALTERSDTKGAAQLATHVGALAVTTALLLLQIPLWPIVLVPHGILLAFLFTAQHECIHDTAFASKNMNRLVARVSGLIILVPATWFRHFHFAHHRHTQDPGRDPELAAPKPNTVAQYLLYLSGAPVALSLFKSLMANAIGCHDDYVAEQHRASVTREARITCVFYAASLGVFAWTDTLYWMFVLWTIPLMLGQPFLRLFLLAEHTMCAHSDNMLENTRTTRTGALVRLLSWQMPYHVEHHAHPGVPFHKLAELHKLLAPQITTLSDGYTHFHRDFLRTLLKPR